MTENCFFMDTVKNKGCRLLVKPYSSCSICPFKKSTFDMQSQIKKYGYLKKQK